MKTENPGESQFIVIDLPDGTKEFILPALRNFHEKISYSITWLFITGFTVLLGFVASKLVSPSGWIGYVFGFGVNHFYYAFGFLGLIQLVLTIFCLDMWLRSSRIYVVPGELRVITRWLFLKRIRIAPLSKIIELRLEDNANDGAILYFKIVVVTVPEKTGRRIDTDPETGGKRIIAATNIRGKDEADRLISEIGKVLGRPV